MFITRKSALTGKISTRDVQCTAQQLYAWRSGALIERVMPFVSADDKEFLVTGITPEEWPLALASNEV